MTTIDIARRAFLRGRGSARDFAPRVPWAIAAFPDACRRCDDCIKACDEKVLVIGDGGYPTVDFAQGGCTFCGACADACRYHALDYRQSAPWSLRATIGEGCLSAQGITCRACGDACDQGAIRFRLVAGGRALADLDSSICNGCGSCIAMCPTHVIQMKEAA